MKIERWDNQEIIFELECNSWIDLIKGAISARISFYRANLRYADLSYADLSSANLRSANLSSAVGNMREVKSLQCEKYLIVFTKERLFIGCESHTIKEWERFSDDEISKMDSDALEWWVKWKEFIFTAIELSFTENIKDKK